jgi:aminopeptidase
MKAYLEAYAGLIVKVGLNLQPGQRLLILGPYSNHGVSLEAAPLVRLIAAGAYEAGARFVEVMWGDEELRLLRHRQGPPESFDEYPRWVAEGALEHVQSGGALLLLRAGNPGLLEGQDPEMITRAERATTRSIAPVLAQIARNATNWCIAAAASPGWAGKVFPRLPPGEAVPRLWEQIFRMCRADRADPVAAWRSHIEGLLARRERLNARRYAALRLTAPGTDLTIGLPPSHRWHGGRERSAQGIEFTPNLPTEEVFSAPHREQTEGVVTATKPRELGGTLVEELRLTFSKGLVVEISAARGENLLRDAIATDEGAGRLGEVALVPHSSPVSQSGLLYFDPLIDENAACHLALGRAPRYTLEGGETMTTEQFAQAGGNSSSVHIDFMVGSERMDVDGITPEGTAEPLMRRGEWSAEPGS